MEQLNTSFFWRAVLTLSLCVVYRGPAKSQTITASELLPPIGTPYEHLNLTNAIPWDLFEGAGVTWDYDWITYDPTDDQSFVAVPLADAPDLAAYPGTDRVVRAVSGANDDYIIHRYYDELPDRLVELGSVGPVLSYVYEAPEIAYAFPMDLGDLVSGDYCFWSDGFGIQYHFCGENYVTFDAVGTLVLPFGTFNDVKHITQWSSSFETTVPATDSTYFMRQQWFAPGIAFPILECSMYTDASGQNWPNGWVMDEASITGIARPAETPTWSVQPNPANDRITVQRASSAPARIEIRAVDGRVLSTANLGVGSLQHTLSIDALPAGTYVVHVIEDGGSTAQRIVKSAH